jgi:cyclopropane fatty-acyl-phospholipid synthase-like methyltransferase
MTKPSLYLVRDNEEFKQANLSNWHVNSDFWLEGRMRHLKDVAKFTQDELHRLLQHADENNGSSPTLFDFGCGDGWIYRLIHENHLTAKYVGIDFNQLFVEELRRRYGESEDHKFFCFDLEATPPEELIGSADVGVNFFNFFELANIEAGFRNVASMLSAGGRLLVVSIDPLTQILAVSESHEKFIENLRQYQEHKHRLGYDKDIDIGDTPSNRIYKSLLYSTADYVRLGSECGLTLEDYKEVIKTGNAVPQIYQFIFFVKHG